MEIKQGNVVGQVCSTIGSIITKGFKVVSTCANLLQLASTCFNFGFSLLQLASTCFSLLQLAPTRNMIKNDFASTCFNLLQLAATQN